jgi:hypothetical protein
MRQFVRYSPRLGLLLALLLPLLGGCGPSADCHELSGRWSDREGQDILFQANGAALWLTRFGSHFDTVPFRFRLDCSRHPATLDLTDFTRGPNVGKTLFAILEWTSDSTFRLRYEVGTQEELRPTEFDNETTLKFFSLGQ